MEDNTTAQEEVIRMEIGFIDRFRIIESELPRRSPVARVSIEDAQISPIFAETGKRQAQWKRELKGRRR